LQDGFIVALGAGRIAIQARNPRFRKFVVQLLFDFLRADTNSAGAPSRGPPSMTGRSHYGTMESAWMHVVGHKAIRIFCEEHPQARNAMDHWYRVAKQAT
jgi:hypothetical protein